MGDPRGLRKQYSTPRHPWNKGRIEEEAVLMKDYGLKKKSEIWRVESQLKNYKNQVKKLVALRTNQAEVERQHLLKRLRKIKLLSENSTLTDVLGLSTRDLMERRLQTLLYRKGLAKTVNQARQFIIHRHVAINGKKITVPAYITSSEEENHIEFAGNSALIDEEHPERKVEVKEDNPLKPAEHSPADDEDAAEKVEKADSGPTEVKAEKAPAKEEKSKEAKEEKPAEESKEEKEASE